MAEDNSEIKIKITSDTTSFTRGVQESRASANSLADLVKGKLGDEGSQAVGQIGRILGGPVLAGFGVVAAAAVAFKKQLDLTVEAERINQINSSFLKLSDSVGIAGDSLRSGLLASADGLADDTDLIQAANRAIIQLGENASILPETLELARKATAGFGGDLVQNFQAFNDAIASGNVRGLRQFGIIIDTDKALKDYAKTLGVSSDLLTDQGRKQAISNAAIAEGQKKLQGIDESQLKATNSLKQLSVSFANLGDAIALANQQSNFFSSILKTTKQVVDDTSNSITSGFGKGAEKTAAQVELLNSSIEKYQQLLKLQEQNASGTAILDQTKQIIAAKKQELAELTRIQQEADERAAQRAGQRGNTNPTQPKDTTLSDQENINTQLQAQRREQANQYLLGLRQSELSAQEARANALADGELKYSLLAQISNEKQILIQQEYDQKKANLRAENAKTELLNATQLAEALALIEAEKNSKIEQAGPIQPETFTVGESYGNLIDGLAAKTNAFALSSRANFKAIGSAMFDTLGGAAGQAFASFGKAIAKGENAIGAFLNSLLASFGAAAIQLGTQFILQGAAYTYAGLPNGPPLIAAGAALATFGGILSGLGGASGGGASGGGGVASSPGNANGEITSNPTIEKEKPTSSVIINIQGNVMDRRSTGLELVEILNEQFSADDGRLVRATA